MFEGITNFFKRVLKSGQDIDETSKDTAKERLHLVLMQDRANVSADFLDLMKQEIIEVIKKYVVVDEKEIDVRLTNQSNEDGTNGAPALYANIPIVNIKNDVKAEKMNKKNEEEKEKEPEEKAEVKTPAKRGRKKKTEEKNTETETKVPEKKEEKKAEKVEKVEEAEENPEDLEEDVTKKEESESLEEKVKEKPEE